MASRSLFFFALVLSLFLSSACLAQANGGAAAAAHEGANVRAARAVDQLVNPNNNPVVAKPLGHYFFYYGDFSTQTGPDYYTPFLLRQFLADIAGTTYMNIVSQYTGNNGATDINPYYAGETFITGYPDGTVLADSASNCFDVLMTKYLKQANITPNPDVMYYIMMSSDVAYYANVVCGNPTRFCGFHSWKTDNGVKYLYGVLTSEQGLGNHGDFSCDGRDGPYSIASNVALSIFSHELFETVTDPFLDAWQGANGGSDEIGDKCSYKYGTTSPSTFKTGAQYNLKFNGHEYLVQQEYSNAAQDCALSLAFNGPPPPPPPVNDSPLPSGVAAQSNPVQVSTAGEPSQSVIPTLDKATGGCIACRKVCRKYRKVNRVCTQVLGGTFTVNNATKTMCCSNLASTSFSFSWSEGGSTCEYNLYYTKLWKLCDALGGHVTCDDSSKGSRLTCTR